MHWRYEVLTHTLQTDDESMKDVQGTLQHMVNQARLELVAVTSIPRQSNGVEVVMFFKSPLESRVSLGRVGWRSRGSIEGGGGCRL